ncbi:MAG: hypothetical protein V1494_08130 [Candidatus Diapherotrites archaeon]
MAWKFETRDITNVWKEVNAFTSVDGRAPTITKNVIGPQLMNGEGCPNGPGDGEECWVQDHETTITVSVEDTLIEGGCNPPSGVDYCDFTITLDGVPNDSWRIDAEQGAVYDEIVFEEDSVHVLGITCYDVAGNDVTDTETFRVDSTPPETDKTFNGPQKIDEKGVEWIDGVTTVTLTSDDPEAETTPEGVDCSIGVDKTWYANELADGESACFNPNNAEYCHAVLRNPYDAEGAKECIDDAQVYCEENWDEDWDSWAACVEDLAHNNCDVDSRWHLYDGNPIPKDEESCHILQYFSIDELGNTEDMQTNCFFVDKTPPAISKDVGDNKVPLCSLDDEGTVIVDESEMNKIKGEFGLTVTKEDIGDSIKWTFDFDEEDISGHTSTGAQVIIANDSVPLFTLGWSPGESTSAPVYKPYSGGWGAATTVLPAGMSVSGNYNETYYEIVIPKDALGGCPYYWAINGEATAPQALGTSSSVQENYPANWGRWTATNAAQGGNADNWWVTTKTPITLNCEDVGPHPSGDVTIYWKWRFDGGAWNEGSYQGESYDLYFNEESVHDLEFWCQDAVQKESEHDTETFRVDDTPPEIDKSMLGEEEVDYLGDCPPQDEEDICFVADNGRGGVHIDVSDPDPTTMGCNVDNSTCNYELWWQTTLANCQEYVGPDHLYNDGTGECFVEGGQFGEDGTDILFTQDSTHRLVVNCEDALGNEMNTDTEYFKVDSTPPVTTKTYGEPAYPENINEPGPYPHWITSDTPITLEATDNKVGVDKTFWRYAVVDNQWCETEASGCSTYDGELPDFTEYTGTVTLPEESCHLIEFYSKDLLGNTEKANRQCVFVDNSAPEVDKNVGENKVACEEGEVCDYYINQNTPISLSCEDVLPHPVGNVSLWYHYRYAKTCDDLGTATWSELVDTEGEPIYFTEDSCHELEYYCEDALGNTSDTFSEIDIVDTQPPEITSSIDGPSIVIGEKTYIDTVTKIHIEATDPDPHPVDNVKCEWSYILDDGQSIFGGDDQAPPLDITFPEESKHKLHVKCWDALKNKSELVETYYADHTPPTTTKTYGDPFFQGEGSEWINSTTPITLTVDDTGIHKTGIKETDYRVTLVDDSYCRPPVQCIGDCIESVVLPSCENAEGSYAWQTYEGEPFTIGEESCHLIEYYSVDNVDKTEKTKKQCVFVDNQPPTPVKTVGDPNSVWTPGKNGDVESYFYPEETAHCWDGTDQNIDCWKVTLMTPIKLECNDPQPHPVDNAKVCFQLGLDGQDATEKYCSPRKYNGEMEDGYCCVGSEIDPFYFKEESEHNLKYYCEDALGNSNKLDVDEEKFKVEGQPFEIKLYKKWNLISVPFVLLDSNVQEVFKGLDKNIESVWSYDGTTGEWSVYRPGVPSNLTEIKPGWGYWVNAYNKVKVLIGGALFSPATVPPSKPLAQGWNLIGTYGLNWQEYPDMDDTKLICGVPFGKVFGTNVYCGLNSLVGSIQEGPRWASLVGYVRCSDYDTQGQWTTMNACINNFNKLYAGRGYWIYMRMSDIYAPATTCIWNEDNICIDNNPKWF